METQKIHSDEQESEGMGTSPLEETAPHWPLKAVTTGEKLGWVGRESREGGKECAGSTKRPQATKAGFCKLSRYD